MVVLVCKFFYTQAALFLAVEWLERIIRRYLMAQNSYSVYEFSLVSLGLEKDLAPPCALRRISRVTVCYSLTASKLVHYPFNMVNQLLIESHSNPLALASLTCDMFS